MPGNPFTSAQDAEEFLRGFQRMGHTEYDWILESQKQVWTISEILEHFGTYDSSWWAQRCREDEINGVGLYNKQTGYRIPRAGLLVFLANLLLPH